MVLQVLQDIQVLQAMELADQAMDFQMILKLVVVSTITHIDGASATSFDGWS